MATNDSAVTVIEQSVEAGVVEWNLDAFPEDNFNRLIPTQTISIPSDLFRPVVQVVVLDPPDREGKSADTYTSRDVPNGSRALTARALAKLMDAAGVRVIDEHRSDDRSDPNVLEVTVKVERPIPMSPPRTGIGVQSIDLRTWFSDQTSEAEKAKFRKQFYGQVSTRARNRAIREVLSLKSSYTNAEIARPFAAFTIAPNTNHPEVRARALDSLFPTTAQLYGPAAAKQLEAGKTINVTPAPEDAPAPTPTPLPGEKLAAAQTTAPDDVPDFLKPPEAVTQLERREPQPLIEALQESAKESNRKGPADDEQKAYLNDLLGSLGAGGIVPVLVATWGQGAAKSLTAAQAASVANIADSYDSPEAFLEAWREVAERVTVAA